MPEPRNHPTSGDSQASISVGVISRVRFIRETLVKALTLETGFIVHDLGSGGEETLALARSFDPDLVLIDLVPREAASLCEALLEAAPGTRPVVIHGGLPAKDLVDLTETGCLGFVTTECSYEDLLRELRGVLREDFNRSPQLAGALIRSFRHDPAAHDPLAALSPREREVARLLEQHYSNKEIASVLGIEFGTVRNHVHNVLAKLHLHNRWEVHHLRGHELDRR